MKTIRWVRPTESGLCDRLYDLHFLSAYARVQGAKLYTKWEKFDLKDIDAPHRRQDILIENVRAHIQVPRGNCHRRAGRVRLPPSSRHRRGGPTKTSGGCTPSICSWDVYKQALAETAKGLRLLPEINAVLATLPEKFAAYTFGAATKCAEPHDGCYIEFHELDRLNELTFKAIDWAEVFHCVLCLWR
jgi:hypothetical protein